MKKRLKGLLRVNDLYLGVYIVDVNKEHIALTEARKLNIPVFGMVDTNSDPTLVDFPIPSNDDASKSISLVVTAVVQSIAEGQADVDAEKVKCCTVFTVC